MPHEIELSSNMTIPPSTSHDINPTNITTIPSECEKEIFSRENQLENVTDCRMANNEHSPQVNDVICENMPDLFNIVLQEQRNQQEDSRPRQYGRRSNPIRISSLATESLNHTPAVIIFFFTFF